MRRSRVRSASLGVSVMLTLGCDATQEPAQAAATPIRAEAAAVEHWLPGPHDDARAPEQRGELEADCRSCHVEIAREWAGSQHAGAWSSAAFERAFEHEALGFCQGCHAPEVPSSEPVPPWAAEIGVGCVSCHVEPGSGQIWAAERGETDPVEPPHPLVRALAFAGASACAACHEFEFPDAAARERPLFMQSTVSEHAASRFSSRSCADCHMPLQASEGGGARHRSHAFPGAYDSQMLARALDVVARREQHEGHERVVLELRPGEVGHAVPSGDLFRRLELRFELVEPGGEHHEFARRWLGRRFGPMLQRNGLTLRGELDDTRVGPRGRTVVVVIPERARGQTVRWQIVHQRVAHATPEFALAMVEGEQLMAAGELP